MYFMQTALATVIAVLVASALVGAQNSTNYSQLMWPVVAELSGTPLSWANSTPLGLWEGFSENPQNNFRAALTGFNLTGKLYLDRLDASFPLTAFVARNIVGMMIHVNTTNLPSAIFEFDISGTPVFNFEGENSIWFNGLTFPNNLYKIDLSGCGLQGGLSLFAGKWNLQFLQYDFSNNFLQGTVDLYSYPCIMGRTIDLRGNHFDTVILKKSVMNLCGTYLFYDPTAQLKGVQQINAPETIPSGFFCRAADEVNLNVVILVVAHRNGRDIVSVLNGKKICTFVTDTINYMTDESGYIQQSAMWPFGLHECLPLGVSYAFMAPANTPTIAFSTPNETIYFGNALCPQNVEKTGKYFSYIGSKSSIATLNEQYVSEEMSVNFTLQAIGPGSRYVSCFYEWPIFVDVTSANAAAGQVYNVPSILQAFEWCLPYADQSMNEFQAWANIQIPADSVNKGMNYFFYDEAGKSAVFQEYFYAPVETGRYCYTSLQYNYEMLLSHTDVTFTKTDGNGISHFYSYTSPLLYLTPIPQVRMTRTFFNFDKVLAACAPGLPQHTPSGQKFAGWNASASFQFQPDLDNPGGLIVLVDNQGLNATFEKGKCSTPVPHKVYCSPVGIGADSLLTLNVSMGGTEMTYWQKNETYWTVSRCQSNVTFWYREDSFVPPNFFLQMVADWNACSPPFSSSAKLHLPFATTSFSQDGISLFETPQSNKSVPNYIILTTAACGARFDNTSCPSQPVAPLSSGEKCYGRFCSPYSEVFFSSGSAHWRTSYWDIKNDDLTVAHIVDFRNNSQVLEPIAQCYPNCFVERGNCAQLAYVLRIVAMCYYSQGYSADSMELPALHDCSDASYVAAVFSIVNGLDGKVQFQCDARGQALLVTPSSQNNSIILIGKDNAASVDFESECIPCVSFVAKDGFAVPYVVIIGAGIVNVILIFVFNCFVRAFATVQINLKYYFLLKMNAVKPGELKVMKAWDLAALSPMLKSDEEVQQHIEEVAEHVQSEVRLQFENNRIPQLSNAVRKNGDLQGEEEFQSLFRDELMCRQRMLARVGAVALERLVSFRVALIRPDPDLDRYNYEYKTARNVVSSQSTENSAVEGLNVALLEPEVKDDEDESRQSLRRGVHAINEAADDSYARQRESDRFKDNSQEMIDTSKRFEPNIKKGEPNLEESSKSFSIRECSRLVKAYVMALRSDIALEWIPYVPRAEWLERVTFLPSVWLLSFQAVYLLIVIAFAFSHSNAAFSQSHNWWDFYQEACFRILNSPVWGCFFANAFFRKYFNDNDILLHVSTRHESIFQKLFRWFAIVRDFLSSPFILLAALCLILPALTHIIVAMVGFPFVLLVCGGAIVIMQWLVSLVPDLYIERSQVKWLHWQNLLRFVILVLHRIVVVIAVIVGIQTSYNYAMLFYRGMSWLDTVKFDYMSRHLVCALWQLFSETSTAVHLFFS